MKETAASGQVFLSNLKKKKISLNDPLLLGPTPPPSWCKTKHQTSGRWEASIIKLAAVERGDTPRLQQMLPDSSTMLLIPGFSPLGETSETDDRSGK